MHDPTLLYRGRFAPSPTGPLHFGSLIAAVGSYLEARTIGGEWLVRMEDLDRPREERGAADAILRILEDYGFEWDGPVIRQSARSGRYAAALAHLQENGYVFPCACSRREISDSTLGSENERVYPGTCRNGIGPGRLTRAIRLRVGDAVIGFDDGFQGRFEQDLAHEVGDFVVKRADGLFAYQLAAVVDDFEQGITDVVRGADLLGSTPRQILLQRRLGYPTPRYGHLPVAVNRSGEKLSKQTLADPLDKAGAPLQIRRALAFLGQEPPETGDLSAIWAWARANWRPGKIPRKRTQAVEQSGT